MDERLLLELICGAFLLCVGYMGERLITWGRKHHDLRKSPKKQAPEPRAEDQMPTNPYDVLRAAKEEGIAYRENLPSPPPDVGGIRGGKT